jgi:DNA-directed RNA polymerase specialized sigma24 family protein
VSCSRAGNLRLVWECLTSDPRGIGVSLLGIAVFGGGLALRIRGGGPQVAFFGAGLVVLGLLLPVVGEVELSLTKLKITTEFHRRDEEFKPFVEAERGHLYRFAVLMVGDPSAARDMVEDALESSYVVWRRLVDVQRGRYVLCRLTHLAVDRSIFSNTLGTPLVAQDVPEAEPLETARTLSQLRPSLRVVLLLRHYESMDEVDIADMLGRPVGDIEKDLSDATELMSRAFEREPAAVS